MTNINNIAQKIVDETLNINQFKMGLDIDFLLVNKLHQLFPLLELKSWKYYIVLEWSSDEWNYYASGTPYFENELLRLYPEALI